MKFESYKTINNNFEGKIFAEEVYDFEIDDIVTDYSKLFDAIEDVASKEVRKEIENYDELWAVDCGHYIAVGDGELACNTGFYVFYKKELK